MQQANQLVRRVAAASVVVALVVGLVSLTALAAGRFTDDDGNIHEGYIEAIADEGITKGCNPPDNTLYCPDEEVIRGEMAAFLVRALDLTDPGDGDLFSDDDESVFEDDIDKLATAGITKGCNPPDNTLFCPNDPVLRDQMASFLGRALGLEPIEPPTTTSSSISTSTTMVAGDLEFTAVQFDAPGGDDRNNLNGEWVQITNQGGGDQDMTGWTLHDEARIHEYQFPDEFVLEAGDQVTVFTGSGSDTSGSLYWGLDGPLWNNDGDTAFLRDADRNIVDRHSGP